MELEGSLKAFSLPEILQFLAMGKLTGTLMVRHSHQGIDLVIRQGRIVNSATLDHTRRIGQMLIYRRLVRRSDLEQVLLEQQTSRPDQMLGQLLMERELITSDDLRLVIKAQLEEEIWELFSWETGDFRFEHCADTDIHNVLIEIDVEPLIIEGTRRIDEWKAIIRNLRGDQTIVGLHPWKPEERGELTLSSPEWQVLALINGFFSIGSIAARAGIGRFETFRILNAFLASGMIFLKEESEADEGNGAREAADTDLPADFLELNGSPSPTSSGRFMNLFGRRRTAEPAYGADRKEIFVSPVGLVARFLNLAAQGCTSHREFHAAADDPRHLQQQWALVVMDCPGADLIKVAGNEVDARVLERYLELDPPGLYTLRVYEDAITALRTLYGAMTIVFSQRMGERVYQRIVQTLEREWLPLTTIRQPRGFDFAQFLSRSLLLDKEMVTHGR